jgi:hypothetical protein
MNKEKYLKKLRDDIDKMPIEQLREYCWRLDRNAQTYFENWQLAEEKIIELEIKLSLKNDD